MPAILKRDGKVGQILPRGKEKRAVQRLHIDGTGKRLKLDRESTSEKEEKRKRTQRTNFVLWGRRVMIGQKEESNKPNKWLEKKNPKKKKQGY